MLKILGVGLVVVKLFQRIASLAPKIVNNQPILIQKLRFRVTTKLLSSVKMVTL
jgi:hypothetical protein